jgi:L-ascorbate metabolism protein UlaG (beta-lactamase superfamily)
VKLTLVRHATLRVELGGLTLLVDPCLDPVGAQPPVEPAAVVERNPLVPLPLPVAEIVAGLDEIVVTHLHEDHFDETAAALLPKELPLLCQPPDAEELGRRGFWNVSAVEADVDWLGLRVQRAEGEHGRGDLATMLAPVSGFVLEAMGEPSLYVAGDTVWCPPVEEALRTHRPAVTVVNAGAAQFLEGGPITMASEDVVALCRADEHTSVVAVHFETWNHCLEGRQAFRDAIAGAGLADRVLVPADGETLELGGR